MTLEQKAQEWRQLIRGDKSQVFRYRIRIAAWPFTREAGFSGGTDQPSTEQQRWIELAFRRGYRGRYCSVSRTGAAAADVMTFWSDDVEELARMKSRGRNRDEPKRQEWASLAAFRDIDGNCFLLSFEVEHSVRGAHYL